MKRSSIVGLVVGIALAGVLGLPGTLQSTRAAGPPGTLSVTETNLDANGLIRVHDQGVTETRVKNLPLDAAGSVRVAGAVEVSKAVEIAKMPSVTIAGTPTVHVDESLKVEQRTAENLLYIELSGVPFGEAGPWSLGSDTRVTSVSLWSSRDTHFKLLGGATFSFHVKADTNVVHSFATPLRANSLSLTCPGGCTVSVSIVGYEQ